jgi:hypothetical protein
MLSSSLQDAKWYPFSEKIRQIKSTLSFKNRFGEEKCHNSILHGPELLPHTKSIRLDEF